MSTSAVDFLRDPHPPVLGWVLLAVGAAALAVALWFDRQWFSERAAATQAEAQLIAARDARRAPARPVEPSLGQRRWGQVRPEVGRPWLPALKAVEAATVNPVFMLSMNVEPATGLIKLEAEAPSFDHALAYVQVLDQSGALRPAVMVSHEQTTDLASGRSFVKFTAATQWVSR
jgi:hypothetical protein